MPEQPKYAEDLGKLVRTFADQIDSIRTLTPPLIAAVAERISVAAQDLLDFLNNDDVVVGTGNQYHIPVGKYSEFQRMERRLRQMLHASTLLRQGYVVTLISIFDAHLGDLIRLMFRMRPEMLQGSEKVLSFSQLTSFASLEEAREYIIEKEVESVLRESHAAHFDWLEKKLGIPLRKDLPSWPVFIEATERRNLFAHAGGRTSRQYIKVCSEHGVKDIDKLQVGEELTVDGAYFRSVCDALYEIGVKLAHVIWRKMDPGTRLAADQNLNEIAFELIQRKRYRLALDLLRFGTETIKSHGSEEVYLFMIINKAQALKWGGDDKEASKVLDAIDWSAKSDALKLANAVLRDQYKEAAFIMTRIGQRGDISEEAYRQWPLFRIFREKNEFIEAYERAFGTPFERLEKVSTDEIKQLTDPLPAISGIVVDEGGAQEDPEISGVDSELRDD